MAEKVTKQQIHDSVSMLEETVLQAKSDGQTASTSQVACDIKKEKENGDELNTADLKSNDRESDIELGGDLRSTETRSSNCNKENRNTEKHELTKVIQQLTDSNDRLITRIDIIDDELTEVRKENKSKSSVCGFIKGFAESSTIHGLPRMAAKGWIWRVFWGILLLGALAISTLQIVDLFKEYYKYPVNMDVSFHFEYPRFPQIAVCMSQPFKSSAAMRHPVLRKYTTVLQLQKDIKDLPEEERIKLGYEASEMVFALFHSDDETIFKPKPTLVHQRIWGNCYAYTPPYGTRIVELYFNLNSNERLDDHDPVVVYVRLTQVGIYPLDYSGNQIQIEPYTKVKSTFQVEEVSKLNGMYGGCQDDEDIFKKRTGLAYTQSLCLDECTLKLAHMKCDCIVHDYLPAFKNHELSNSRKCVSNNDYKCFEQAYYSKMNCQCKVMCRQSVYSLRTEEDGIQDDPGLFNYISRKFLNSSCDNCTDWAQQKYASFDLRVAGKYYKEYKQKPLYLLPRFMSDIGGTLGLYLGSSVLTLFELIHMMSGLILFLLKRRRTE